MGTWKRRFELAILSISLLVFTPNYGHAEICEPCNPCAWEPCDFGGLEIYGDFIYWKPCPDSLDYAAEFTNLPSTTGPTDSYSQVYRYKCLCTDWEPGYRVGIALSDIWCDWRLSGSFTFHKSSASSILFAESGKLVVSPFQHPSMTNPQVNNPSTDPDERTGNGGFKKIRGDLHLCYQTWDVLISRAICSNDCYIIAPFFGAEGLLLDQEIKTKSFLDAGNNGNGNGSPGIGDGFASTKWESDFCAYGVKFGTDYSYQILDCIKFFTRASATIGVGENEGKNAQRITYNSINGSQNSQHITFYEDEDCCMFINGYHLQLGLLYETEFCGKDFGVRLGYEFIKWHNLPQPRKFPGGAEPAEDAQRAISTAPDSGTLGFHGIFAGAALSF